MTENEEGTSGPVAPAGLGAAKNNNVKTGAKPHRRLDHSKFPHPPAAGGGLPATMPNLQHMLQMHGMSVHWDVIRKRTAVRDSNGDEVPLTEIYSLAALNGFGSGNLLPFLNELGRRSPLNPVEDWIRSRPWDRRDRLQAVYGTVTSVPEYQTELKEALLHRWLLSATAAALKKRGFHSRGVLTFQGPQGIGKTTWFSKLVPAGALRDSCVKLDFYMDGGSKDSLMIAIQHWICELGELESSFRKDVARLKGFITNDCDKFRPPYGRIVEEFPRRTVFAATVNDEKFLIDSTGNSRWWTIPVESLDYQHNIDMQQLFAQLAVELDRGEPWWLQGAEEAALTAWNKRHIVESAIAEQVRDYLTKYSGRQPGRVTATEMLRLLGIQRPTNAQCRECGRALRDALEPPKRIHGIDKWTVPIAPSADVGEEIFD
jgi:putative DNA primase/helicase